MRTSSHGLDAGSYEVIGNRWNSNIKVRMTMNEKIYKTMSSTGACSLAVGIIVLTTGIVTGVMMIVSGARLLKKKSEILI